MPWCVRHASERARVPSTFFFSGTPVVLSSAGKEGRSGYTRVAQANVDFASGFRSACPRHACRSCRRWLVCARACVRVPRAPVTGIPGASVALRAGNATADRNRPFELLAWGHVYSHRHAGAALQVPGPWKPRLARTDSRATPHTQHPTRPTTRTSSARGTGGDPGAGRGA